MKALGLAEWLTQAHRFFTCTCMQPMIPTAVACKHSAQPSSGPSCAAASTLVSADVQASGATTAAAFGI